MKIPFEFDYDNHLEGANYINAIRDYQASHGKDKVNHAEGELPETRRKYIQVTQFLHEIDNSKDIDPKPKTNLEHNKEIPDLVPEQKK